MSAFTGGIFLSRNALYSPLSGIPFFAWTVARMKRMWRKSGRPLFEIRTLPLCVPELISKRLSPASLMTSFEEV